jgi:hypothetical protein
VDCGTPGRTALDGATATLARETLAWRAVCDTTETPACSEMTLCELVPAAAGAGQQSCLSDPDGSVTSTGYCYIDAMADTPIGDPALVAQCPPDQQRLVRFTAPGVPAAGAHLLMLCPD